MDLSVIVCTYNRSDRARQTVRGIKEALATVPTSSEIVVVDDGSAEPFQDDDHGGAILFRHHRNLGVSAGDLGIVEPDGVRLVPTQGHGLGFQLEPLTLVGPLDHEQGGHGGLVSSSSSLARKRRRRAGDTPTPSG